MSAPIRNCRVGAVSFLVVVVFLVGSPPKIIDMVVVSITIPMSDLVFRCRLRWHECHSNELMNLEVTVLLFEAEGYLEIAIVTRARLQNKSGRVLMAGNGSPHSSQAGNFVVFMAGDCPPLFVSAKIFDSHWSSPKCCCGQERQRSDTPLASRSILSQIPLLRQRKVVIFQHRKARPLSEADLLERES